MLQASHLSSGLWWKTKAHALHVLSSIYVIGGNRNSSPGARPDMEYKGMTVVSNHHHHHRPCHPSNNSVSECGSLIAYSW